jgi:leucyl aminopeptidase (aminopeptidase T)
MVFGVPHPELMAGAENAVRTCLAIQPGERVVLMADQASAAVAASLEHALTQQGARTEGILIESLTGRPMRLAPPPLLAALESADAGILCVQPQEGELAARMAIVAVVERRRIR